MYQGCTMGTSGICPSIGQGVVIILHDHGGFAALHHAAFQAVYQLDANRSAYHDVIVILIHSMTDCFL